MADYDRYGSTYSRDRNDNRSRRYDEDNRSIFGFGGSNDRWRDEDRNSRGFGGRRSGFERDDDRAFSGNRDRNRERGYGSDDYREGLPIDETSHLIASNKVEGTRVYGRDGEKLGSIYNFMVDKRSGRVEYAVMSYGGFLGMGERYYPLPWKMLHYDERQGGYHVDMRERDLEDAPSFDRNSEPRFNRRYGSEVHDYYGVNY